MPLPTYETMLVDVNNGVATVSMNRPDRLNAMNQQFFADLKQVFADLTDMPEVRVAVLKGEGRHYTAGLDLKESSGALMDTGEDPARVRERFYRHVKYLQSAISAVEVAPFPVIAAIHGACIGGGVDLTSACDMRIAEAASYFTVQEIEIGIVADIGTLQRLPKLIPPGIVRELAYTGRRYSAAEAEKHGFVNAIGETREDVYVKADALAGEIASKSPLAITGIKKTILNARDHTVDDALDFVATWNSGMLIGQDVSVAVQATLAKSKAEFKDRLEDIA